MVVVVVVVVVVGVGAGVAVEGGGEEGCVGVVVVEGIDNKQGG